MYNQEQNLNQINKKMLNNKHHLVTNKQKQITINKKLIICQHPKIKPKVHYKILLVHTKGNFINIEESYQKELFIKAKEI